MNNKILIISDDSEALQAYGKALRPRAESSQTLEATSDDARDVDGACFDITTAPNGSVGVETMEKSLQADKPFVTAIIDVNLPSGWNGTKTARELRRLDAKIYIIIVTDYTDKLAVDLQVALKHHVMLLQKPCEPGSLYQMARIFCASRDKDEELTRHRENLEDIVAKRTRELSEANERLHASIKSREQFFTNASLDIRTPLSCILGIVEIITDTHLSEEQKAHLRHIDDTGNKLVKMLDEILSISQLSTGQHTLTHEIFSVAEIANNLRHPVKSDADKKGIKLNWFVASDIPPLLLGDSNIFSQVIGNLVFNAIKFTEDGEVSLNISVKEKGDDHVTILVAVRDTGAGIPPSLQETIFDPYTRNIRHVGESGAGLGLPIAHRLARLMHGSLGVKSEVGFGSLFMFTARFGLCKQKHNKDLRTQHVGLLRPCKALVVDDVPVNQIVLINLLTKWSCTTITANNGKEALGILARESCDIVLMDVSMPVMNGFEATRILREREMGSKKHTPVVAVTAVSSADLKEKAFAAGMDGFISKPVTRKKLYDAIKPFVGVYESLSY